VAVVDLNEVARRLGRLGEIGDELKAKGKVLNDELSALSETLKEDLDTRIEGVGEEPAEDATDEEKKEYAQKVLEIRREINVQFQQKRQEAQRTLNDLEQRRITAFREKVRPVAKKIATSRGLTLVVPKNDNLTFVYAVDIDITEEVIEELVGSSTTGDTGGGSDTPEGGSDTSD